MILGIIIGVFIGGCVGVVVMAIMQMARMTILSRKEKMMMEIKIPTTIDEKEMKAICEKIVTEMKSRGDLVYVVRCKDCKNYIAGNCDTILDGYSGGDDFYCAAGEPRGDGGENE